MVNDELAGGTAPSHSRSSSMISAEKPVYNSLAKTLRAAEAAMAELAGLSGEDLRKQQERVNELVVEANQQNKAFKMKNPGARSQVYSARTESNKSGGEASSPHPSRSKAKAGAGAEVLGELSNCRHTTRHLLEFSKPDRTIRSGSG